jgi:hypothetical protein
MSPLQRFGGLCVLAGFTFGILIGASTTHPADAVTSKTIVVTRTIQVTNVHALAKELLTPKQYECLDYVITRESHWNPLAVNPTSRASGLGQLLPATWQNLNYMPSQNANAQLIATLIYIARHFGSGGTCAAAAYWRHHSSY